MGCKIMSHKIKILKHLKRYGSITPMQALRLGSYRLGARIMELRQEGHEIKTIITNIGNEKRSKYILVKL